MPTTDGDTTREIIQAIKDGKLDEKVLDENVDRLLDIIFTTTEALNKEGTEMDVEKHHKIAQTCA